jgi:hypothetical protein
MCEALLDSLLMVDISVITPLDQPMGRRRLLEELKGALRDSEFSRFQFIVAFAKAGPLLRLKSLIDQRRAQGLRIDAIFGLDQQGTTAQALTFALDHFSMVYVTREPHLTFHPKIYMWVPRGNPIRSPHHTEAKESHASYLHNLSERIIENTRCGFRSRTKKPVTR